MTDRLTIAAARPGIRDRHGYLRWTPTSCRRCGYEKADCTCLGGFAAPASYQPTLAALLAERAPEFLAAVREWRTWLHGERVDGRVDATPQDDALLAAIEAAGILDKPAPSQPFHPPIYGVHVYRKAQTA